MSSLKPIKILKASAGSGKTFQLVRFYLQLCFTHLENIYYFRHILAITFTNKATNEMRERILDEVRTIAESPHKSQHLEHLREFTGKKEEIIVKHAQKLVKAMIQHYEQISVSTIDSFFQRVLRSFTRELGIDSSFQIQINPKEVLEPAVNKLIQNIDKNHPLYSWMKREMYRKISDNKKFQLRESLNAIAEELYSEQIDLDEIGELDFKELSALYDYLRKREKVLKEENLAFIATVEGKMEEYNFTVEDFMYANSGFMGTLTNKKDLNKLNDVLTLKRLQEVRTDPSKMYKKADKARRDEYLSLYNNFLKEHIEGYIAFAEKAYIEYKTNKLILEEFVSFITLHELISHINEVKKENNWIVLAETNRHLKNLMESMFIPFLYEKIAVEYKHLLIDEFQDTSIFQWNNLRPLLEENASQDLRNLVVGDVKQAIYRFRNGNWEILQSELASRYPDMINTQTLPYNFRSDENIINFNNKIFDPEYLPTIIKTFMEKTWADNVLKEDSQSMPSTTKVLDIYSDSHQNFPEVDSIQQEIKGKGYVELNFIEKEVKEEKEIIASGDELYRQRLYEIFCNLQNSGYKSEDIAILCNRKKQITKTVEIIEEFKAKPDEYPDLNLEFLNYVNNDALELRKDRYVRYIIANFKMMLEPDEPLHHYEVLSLAEENYDFKDNLAKMNERINIWRERHAQVGGSSLMEIAEILLNFISVESLEKHTIYLHSFFEELVKYQADHSPYLSEFLDWWDAENVKLTLPEDVNAMELMTVHNAKGLAFPVVIMPFLDWEFGPTSGKKHILWVDYKYNELKLKLPINWTYPALVSSFTDITSKEMVHSHIDYLNLFYVGMTRAKHEIYVLCTKPNNDEKFNAINQALFEFIQKPADFLEQISVIQGVKTYVHGTQEGRLRADAVKPDAYTLHATHYRTELPHLRTLAWEENILATDSEKKERVLQGNAIHFILENIEYSEDVQKAINTAILNGIISENEKSHWLNHINQLFSDTDTKALFSRKYSVMREREIITANGKVLIPDRVIFNEDQVHIIDFKSGEKQDYYRRQVERYKTLYEEMGYENVRASLLYTHLFQLERIA